MNCVIPGRGVRGTSLFVKSMQQLIFLCLFSIWQGHSMPVQDRRGTVHRGFERRSKIHGHFVTYNFEVAKKCVVAKKISQKNVLCLLQLALKTVNSARSAYASFLFCQSFFHSYSNGQSVSGSQGCEEVMEDEDTTKCKITIKVSCSLILKPGCWTP